MTVQLRFRLDETLKNEYCEFIEEEYGQRRGKIGLGLSKWIKLDLALNGHSEYMEDSSVQEMIKIIQERFVHTHTKNNESKSESKETNGTSKVEKLEQKLEEMQKSMDEMKAQLVQTTQKEAKTEHKKERDYYRQMDQFVSAFQEEYGDHHQVSLKEISKLVMRTHRVTDKRSITNRVDYLVANEYIEPYAPNVYNIR